MSWPAFRSLYPSTGEEAAFFGSVTKHPNRKGPKAKSQMSTAARFILMSRSRLSESMKFQSVFPLTLACRLKLSVVSEDAESFPKQVSSTLALSRPATALNRDHRFDLRLAVRGFPCCRCSSLEPRRHLPSSFSLSAPLTIVFLSQFVRLVIFRILFVEEVSLSPGLRCLCLRRLHTAAISARSANKISRGHAIALQYTGAVSGNNSTL